MANYRFSFDSAECLNCGVCVDVCPVRCLDMTRPQRPGPESTLEGTNTPAAQAWMTIAPVQIGRCTGCMVCAMECPTDIISIDKVEGEVPFAPAQGPIIPEPQYEPARWQPLSAFTRTSHKTRPMGDPWGPEHKWRPVRRNGTWRVWRTWRTREDFEQAQAAPGSATKTEEE